MALTKIDDRGVTYPLDLLDNEKIRFGTGNDIEVFHDASHSWITNTTGDLMLKCTGDDIVLQSQDDINMYVQGAAASPEKAIIAVGNGAVELYYDNSQKAATYAEGLKVTGDFWIDNPTNAGKDIWFGDAENKMRFYDDVKASFGSSDDLQIYHDGSNTYIDNDTGALFIQAAAIVLEATDGENYVKGTANGAVELYYDNSKKAETTATGMSVNGGVVAGGNIEINTDAYLKIGASADVSLAHTGGNSYLQNSTGFLFIHSDDLAFRSVAQENYLVADADNEVALYFNAVKKFETTAGGVSVTGDCAISGELNLMGDSDANKYIDARIGTNALHIRKATGGDAGHETMAAFKGDGAVELYHNNVKTLETTNDGAQITGYGSGINLPNATLKIRTSDGGEPVNDKTMLVLQNGIDAGDLSQEDSYIDFVFRDSNDNRTPQTRIAARVGDGGNASSVAKEGRGYLTFHCSNTSTEDNNEWNPSERFRIAANGDLTATDTSISSNSDSRLKKDVTDYSYSLSTFKQFKPKTFNWINPRVHTDKNQRGFVAQEVKAVDPYFAGNVTVLRDSPDVPLLDSNGVANTTKLGETDAMYISVIQQLLTKIETLETKVAALEAK